MSDDTMAKWASEKGKGDLLNDNGLWKPDGRIERGNMLPDKTIAKSYVDTSLENFGETTVIFQEPGQKHRDFSGGESSCGAVFCNLLA
jgi:hypothetical protein